MFPLCLILALALYAWSGTAAQAWAGEDPAPPVRAEDQAPNGDAPAATEAEPPPPAADTSAATAPATGESTKETTAVAADTQPASAQGPGDSEPPAGELVKASRPEVAGAAALDATPPDSKDTPKKARVKRPPAKAPGSAANGTKEPAHPALPLPGPTPPSESDRVTRELDRTDRAIVLAKRRVDVSKNGRAQKTVSSALDFQVDARETFKLRQYARSERLTLAARGYADRAVRMIGPPPEDPEYVEIVLKRTDDALDRAKDVMKNGAGSWAWKRHESLNDSQKDAWKAFKDGAVGDAYKRSLTVRRGVLDLLGQLENLPVARETAEKAINGAKAALDRAGKDLGPRPPGEAARLVRLANTYIEKAQDSYNRRSYRAALLQAKVAEQNLEKAVDAARPRS